MTVKALKEAITEKEKRLLRGVPAKSLEIWKVSIAVEGLRAKLAKLKDSSGNGIEKLGPRRTLGKAFRPQPVDGFLHIVVRLLGEHPTFMPEVVHPEQLQNT